MYLCCLPNNPCLHLHNELSHGSKQAMTKYLWSYMTPWLQADIDVVARAPDTDAFENSPFLALHVRRGDKVRLHEAEMYLCEVCTFTQHE